MYHQKAHCVNTSSLYDPHFVRRLFDEMSRTYGITNFVSSFGFCKRWRAQCVAQVAIEPYMTVYDLMTGMGECCDPISRQLQGQGQILALDFSPAMCHRARQQAARFQPLDVTIVEQDMLANTLEDASADCVISTFGLKTFSDEQQRIVAQEMYRILRPGGLFSLLEISVPPNRLLRLPYMFYLKQVVPVIGKLLLGNPDNYRLLGVYTEQFNDCTRMAQHLRAAGFHVEYTPFFFGCAIGVYGRKPSEA